LIDADGHNRCTAYGEFSGWGQRQQRSISLTPRGRCDACGGPSGVAFIRGGGHDSRPSCPQSRGLAHPVGMREWMLASLEMLNRQLIAAVAPTVAQSARHWIFQLGGLGFIPLGLLDSSILPLPGSMDVLTIVLSARHGELWSYYALMATVGSVLGGYVTYRLARKGGKETLARKFPRRKLDKIYKIFNRWGFGSVAIPALLPPPAPMVPFLLAAGALQYSAGKFLAALTLGRMVRYAILAYLAARYGRHTLTLVSRVRHPILIAAIALVATAVVVLAVMVGSKRKKSAAA
jgi:membrane protein YqaA with SNARE-associated domain